MTLEQISCRALVSAAATVSERVTRRDFERLSAAVGELTGKTPGRDLAWGLQGHAFLAGRRKFCACGVTDFVGIAKSAQAPH